MKEIARGNVVNGIPDGYHTVTPFLIVEDALALIGFLELAFESKVEQCHLKPDGSVMHAAIRIGDSVLMLTDACTESTALPVCLYLYVSDADASYTRAVQAGATSIQEPVDQFYGDRAGGVTDPAGNTWWVATKKEDLSPEQIRHRASIVFQQSQSGTE